MFYCCSTRCEITDFTQTDGNEKALKCLFLDFSVGGESLWINSGSGFGLALLVPPLSASLQPTDLGETRPGHWITISWVMLWWSHNGVNIRILGIDRLVRKDWKQALLSQDARFTRPCYKDSLSFPLPYHFFFSINTYSLSLSSPTLVCHRFWPWLWFTFPLTHHLFFNFLVRPEVKMRS